MPRKKKRYEVIGAASVLIGTTTRYPGEKFEAAIDPTHEEFLVAAGVLKVLRARRRTSHERRHAPSDLREDGGRLDADQPAQHHPPRGFSQSIYYETAPRAPASRT